MCRFRAVPAADQGSVTAETAVALPSLVLVLAVALAGLAAATAQLRCVDAARIGVRAAVRGEPPAAVEQAVLTAAPEGARVVLRQERGEVRVDVEATLRFPGPVLSRLPPLVVRSQAVGRPEPGVGAVP